MKSSNGWISQLARRTVRGLARVYYPGIEISGANHIPTDGPLLLTANHQNSLMDPVMVGLAAIRPVRFLARAPAVRDSGLREHPARTRHVAGLPAQR